jgi:hypothetical protein
MLHPNLESQDLKTLEALEFYCSHTAQIEVVRHDRSLGTLTFTREVQKSRQVPYWAEIWVSLQLDRGLCMFTTGLKPG